MDSLSFFHSCHPCIASEIIRQVEKFCFVSTVSLKSLLPLYGMSNILLVNIQCMTANDSIKCRCAHSGMTGQVGSLSASISFPTPSLLFYLPHFLCGLWLLQPANSRCISGHCFSPSEGEKRRPEMRLLFAGYGSCSLFFAPETAQKRLQCRLLKRWIAISTG